MIVGYKWVKSVVEVVSGGSLLVLPAGDAQAALRDVSTKLTEHVAEAWSHALAGLLARAATPRHVELIAAALVLDGLLSALEGWALQRRLRWGRWMVIALTSALLPFELLHRTGRLGPFRVATILANVTVVAYLVRRWKEPASPGGRIG